MKLRKAASVLTAGMLLTLTVSAAAGCAGGSGLAEKMFDFGDEYYKSVETRHSLNYDEMLYDDFTKGVDLNRWVISDSVWEQWETDQNGVRPQNVFLVDDKNNPETHLLLRANGSYYNMENDPLYTEEEKAAYGNNKTTLFNASQGYGRNTGACLSTLEALGPGRYDVKMKVCPRVGALTSMWVYSWFTLNDGSTQQNEIDIEIGLEPDFTKVYYTTWTSPNNNSNYPYESPFYVNDGDWHIYSFDWITDVEVPYVDYYIDGVKVFTLDSNVPTTNATLNLGLWVPSWAGGGTIDTDADGIYSKESRMFDTDYAEISWWRYIPFQMEGWEQRTVINRNYAEGYVPKKLTSLPTAEKCANGDFEVPTETYKSYGNPWIDFTPDETTSAYIPGSLTEIIKETAENSCAKITNGGLLAQWLRGATTGFKYKVSGKFRTEGDAEAAFRYTYVRGYATSSGTNGNTTKDLGKSAEWKDFEFEFTIDKAGTKSIRYYLLNSAATKTGGNGSCYFDDIKISYLGYNPSLTYPNA